MIKEMAILLRCSVNTFFHLSSFSKRLVIYQEATYSTDKHASTKECGRRLPRLKDARKFSFKLSDHCRHSVKRSLERDLQSNSGARYCPMASAHQTTIWVFYPWTTPSSCTDFMHVDRDTKEAHHQHATTTITTIPHTSVFRTVAPYGSTRPRRVFAAWRRPFSRPAKAAAVDVPSKTHGNINIRHDTKTWKRSQ